MIPPPKIPPGPRLPAHKLILSAQPLQPQAAIVVLHGRGGGKTAALQQMDELLDFDVLLTALEMGIINRDGWDRMRASLAKALIYAQGGDGNDIGGLKGYVRLLRKWERSKAYDGHP